MPEEHTAYDPRGVKRWERLQAWIAIQKLPKHFSTLLPFLLGTTIADWQTETLDIPVFLLAALVGYFLTNGTFISNEVYDYESDKANLARIGGEERVSLTTTGGSRVLVKERIDRRHALAAAVGFFVLALPIPVVLQFGLGTGPLTIPLGLLGVFIGWFYTAPPIAASHNGLGELFISIGHMGLVIFGYYVQLGADLTPFVIALPLALATPALKVIREFPDYEADRDTDKRTLVVIYGAQSMARVYLLLIALAVIAFIPGALIIQHVAYALVLIPIGLLLASTPVMLNKRWRDPSKLERAAAVGFIGMHLIHVALILAMLLGLVV